MKKKLLTILLTIFVLCASAFTLSACGVAKFKVNFIVDGEVYATIDTTGSEIIQMPENPTKEDYTFDGWYWDKDTWQTPFTANSLLNAPLSSDMNVYCKWIKTSNGSIENMTDLTLKTLSFDGENIYGKVANSVEMFSFLTEITTSNNVKYNVSFDMMGNEKIESKTLPLVVGDNIVYITKLVNNEVVAIYKTIIHRRFMCNVIFNSNGGTSVQSQIVEEDSFATEPITSRIGYTFDGWDYNFNTPITSDTIITASWNANKNTPYKVEYYLENLEDENYSLTETANKTGTTDTIANAEIKTFAHFTHKASLTDSGNIAPNGATVLKVYYTRDKYTVTFNGNGGTLVSGNASQTVKYGGSVVAPTFAKTGYTFTGFDKSLTNVCENFIITAQWKINQYTLTLVYDNGEKDKVITQDYNSAIESIANPTKVGYTFVGWNKSIPTYMPAEDLTITANWKINQYTITLVYNNGEKDKIITQDYNTAIESIANPTKVGYTFNGWSKSIPTYMPAEDLIITANWKINQYTLTIVYGNGENNKVITQDYNTAIEYQLPASLSRAGYTFDGWSESIPTYMPAEDLTITAKWLAIFNLSGGEITSLTAHGKTLTQFDIPNAIDGVSITSIGESAFNGCTLLTSVIIGENVQSIGISAFRDCTAIEEINFNATNCADLSSWNYAFYNAGQNGNGIKVIFGNNVTHIPACLFYPHGITSYYPKITSVTIGSGVQSIGNSAFGYCTAIEEINFNATNCADLSEDNYVFAYAGQNGNGIEVTFGNSVTHIPAYLFYSWSSSSSSPKITSVTIGNSVQSIGDYAFYGCTALKGITIPNSVQSIGNYAFEDCTSLKSVTIGSGVQSIGEYAFYYCTAIEEINFNATNCADLSSNNYVFAYAGQNGNGIKVTFGNNVTHIPAYLFHPYSSNASYSPKVTSVTIGNNVQSIGFFAFKNCTAIEKVNYLGSIDSWAQIEFGNEHANPAYYSENLYINGAKQTQITINAQTINAYAFYGCEFLTNVTIGNGVQSIGEHAFCNCTSLTSIIIGSGVQSIDSYAFFGCTAIEEINFNATNCANLSENDYVFAYAGKNGNGIKVTFGNNVTHIPAYLFAPFSSNTSSTPKITSVTIGNNVQSIGNYAFYCTAIEEINFNATNCADLSRDNFVFSNAGQNGNGIKVTFGNSVTHIPAYLFEDCTALTSVTIGSGVQRIGGFAFRDCTALKSVTIGNNVQSMGNCAFAGCTALTSIEIPNSVQSIGDYAFEDCTAIEKVNYWGTVDSWAQIEFGYDANPLCNGADLYINGVKQTEITINAQTIKENAFYGCKSLTSVTIGSGVQSIGSYAFRACTSLTSVTIGENVQSIGEYAFSGCSSLTSIEIPNNVQSIGNCAFSSCTALTSIEIPNSVQSIGSYAFYGCDSLTSVTIGSGVQSIGSSAFSFCYSLTNIYFNDTSTWYRTDNETDWENKTGGTETDVTTSSTNVGNFKYHGYYYWYKI